MRTVHDPRNVKGVQRKKPITGQSTLSLYELFFEIELTMTERFPALTPLSIRREKAREVFLLTRRLQRYNEYKKQTNGKKIIRKPASDDWF